jgi:hypothetical protein
VAGLSYFALTPPQRAAYTAALGQQTARTDLRVTVLNLDHVHQGDISKSVTDGTLTFDRNNDVERSATVSAYDVDGYVGDLDLRHLVRVEHGLKVEHADLDDWVFTPAITGRVVQPSDDGDVTQLELHGKEMFGLMPGAPTREWPQGRLTASVIRDMLTDIGEAHFSITPSLLVAGAPKLSNKVHSGGADEEKAPTRVARRLANQAGIQVFWDAMGVCVIRKEPETPAATWSENPDSSVTPLTSRLRWSRDLREVRNVVSAKGKRGINVTVYAPSSHIYSSVSLKRGGKLGHLIHYWEEPSIGSASVLRSRATATLNGLLTERTDAKFDAVPAYHVGPHDLIEAQRRDGKWGRWWMATASIPLGSDGTMSVGYLPNIPGGRRL